MAKKERKTLIVRVPYDMKQQLCEAVDNGPYPSINQFIVEACREKLRRAAQM